MKADSKLTFILVGIGGLLVILSFPIQLILDYFNFFPQCGLYIMGFGIGIAFWTVIGVGVSSFKEDFCNKLKKEVKE